MIKLKNIKNSTKNFFSKEVFKGFTLVELLVVISVVAVVASVTVVFLGQTRASARDGKRQTEIHTLETTLQQYHSDHGNYPKEETGIIIEEKYQDEAGTFYMEMKDEYLPSSPEDPLYGSGKTYVDAEGVDRDYGYRYVTNDDGSEYALFNGLETSGDYIESYSSGSAGGTLGWEGVPATPPSPPTGLRSIEQGPDYVVLAWDPNPEADIAGYKIHYKEGEVSIYSELDVGNQTSYVFNGLSSGTTYYFSLTAYDVDAEESNPSEEMMIITPPPPPGNLPTE